MPTFSTFRRHFASSIIALSALCFLTIFVSCKKNDFSIVQPQHDADFVKKFFTPTHPVNDVVARVIAKFQVENNLTGFVSKLPVNCGLPVWDKLALKTNENTSRNGFTATGDKGDTTIILPLTNNDESLSAIITATPDDDGYVLNCYTNNWLYNICHATDLDTAYASKQLAFFFYVENLTFGTTTFYHIPSALIDGPSVPNNDGTKTITIAPVTQPTPGLVISTVCIQITCPPSYVPGCIPNTVCLSVPGDGSPVGGGDGGSGGSGSGTGTGGQSGGGSGGNGSGAGGGTTCPLTTNVTWYGLMPPPDPCGGTTTVPANVLWLQALLGLTYTQTNWLTQHVDRANELYNYLELGSTADQKEIARAHITLLMSDASYLSFVATHAQAGTSTIMWWQDDTWLKGFKYKMPDEDIFNLYIDAAKPKHKKPQEFINKCDGIAFMTQASSNDGRERSGCLTLDGKFLLTETGTESSVDIGIKIKNGQTYYTYQTSLGSLTQNYPGTLIIGNEYWIPVRTNVHIHIPKGNINGTSITLDPKKSYDDDYNANTIQGNSGNVFNLYVIEVKDNGNYLVADYTKDDDNYEILGYDILQNAICEHIN